MSSVPIFSSATRPGDAQRLRRHRAHHRELQQVLGTAIDIGAQVEQLAVAFLRRNRRHHRRPINPRQGLEHETRQRHQRPGIAGTDTGLGLAVTHQLRATRIDESGLPRKAWAGFSSMVMTSDAGTIVRRARSAADWPLISSSRREG
jgi:hypothetical protein